MCLWQHGEEALAKVLSEFLQHSFFFLDAIRVLCIQALVACRLYKSLATEAAEDYLEVEICDELKKYAEYVFSSGWLGAFQFTECPFSESFECFLWNFWSTAIIRMMRKLSK